MNTLELADALDADADLCYAEAGNWDVCALEWNAAKELRRLHEVNAALLEALKEILDGEGKSFRELCEQARDAIQKSEGDTA
jgi:hypothetical protein